MTDMQTTRPGRRHLRIALIVVSAVVVLIAALSIGTFIGAKRSETINAWLARAHEPADANADGGRDEGAGYWTCGMHPWVILPEPGLCPVCHMDLTPLDASKLRGEIVIDPVVVQNIGVRIAPVTTGPLTKTIRTVGSLVHDETTIREINLRFEGWIETLYVEFEGSHVHQGDPLFDIYSPALFSAQRDLLLAQGQPALERASRDRLQNLGVTPAQIDEVIERGTASRTMTYLSPVTGHVVHKNAFEGMHVEPGTTLYRIADHTRVWVLVSVYEWQLPFVEEGMPATMRLPFLPGRIFEGRITFVQPHLNAQERQMEVRLEFDNPDLLLKPGMFADIRLAARVGAKAVLAPREAIITTGERTIAFVSLGDGRFEPRDVITGLTADGGVQILEGLEPGEMVVTSGQFLLDSESRMREALAKMVAGNQASEQRPDVEAIEARDASSWPAEAQEQLTALLRAYLDIADTLSHDQTTDVAANAGLVRDAFAALTSTTPASDAHFWHERADDVASIESRADAMAAGGDIESIRIEFGHLSDALDRLVADIGVPDALGMLLDRRICGMAPDVPRDGVWIQPAEEDVRNPYFGDMMLRCNMPSEHRRLPMMASQNETTSEDAP